MKSPNLVLKQWLLDRISFTICSTKYYSKEELEWLIASSFSPVSVNDHDYHEHVHAGTPFKYFEMRELVRKINWKRNRKWLQPQNFAKFYSLAEMAEFFGVRI